MYIRRGSLIPAIDFELIKYWALLYWSWPLIVPTHCWKWNRYHLLRPIFWSISPPATIQSPSRIYSADPNIPTLSGVWFNSTSSLSCCGFLIIAVVILNSRLSKPKHCLMFLPSRAICLCGLEFKLASPQVCQVWRAGPQHCGRLGLLPGCGRFDSSAAFFWSAWL